MSILKSYFFILMPAALLLSGHDPLHAQCCTSGNPFISDAEQPALQSKVLTASLLYRYNNSHQYYYNDARYNDLPFTQRSFSNYMEMQLAYGITGWMTVQSDLGYFINKTQETSNQQTYRGNGLGDLALQLKFNAWHHAKARFSVSPAIGVKFPIGVFDQEVDYVKLPITVQPSSGSFKYNGSVFVYKGFGRKLSLAAYGSYEYSQMIDSENFYYKYGDLWIAAVYFNYQVWKRFNVNLQFRNEYRARASRENNETVSASGYEVVFFTPQVTVSLPRNWYLSAYADIPVYKYYNDLQMSFGYAVSFKVTRKIDFIALKARHGRSGAGKTETEGNNSIQQTKQ